MTDRRIEYLTLASLKPHPRNPKDHDIGEICRSITRFGFNDAVIIDERTGRLVSGHGRVEALRALEKEWRPLEGGKLPEGIKLQAGAWCVPVQRGWASRDETEAEAFIVAANRLVEIGGYNDENLEAILRDLAQANALDGVGFDRDDVDDLIRRTQPPEIGFPGLPFGERSGVQQVTFTLSAAQAVLVKEAMNAAGDTADDTGNQNRNGNALANVCRKFLASRSQQS